MMKIIYVALCLGWMLPMAVRASDSRFTPLHKLPSLTIVSATKDYPGGNHRIGHLLDGVARTEYSSDSKGI